MENRTDSMFLGMLDANTTRFEWSSPGRSRPRCVSPDNDLGGGVGDGENLRKGGPIEIATLSATYDLETDGSMATGFEEPSSESGIGSGDVDSGGETEGLELQQVSMSRASFNTDQDASFSPGFDEPLVDVLSVFHGKKEVTRRRYREIPEFREPSAGRETAIEGVLRKSGDRHTAYIVTIVTPEEFDSLPETYDWTNRKHALDSIDNF